MANVDITRIASNIGAMNALNSLTNINKQLALHQGRLQTGKAINSAADDPAGYAIATKMNARSEGLTVAMNNIDDAGNMMSVAESGLSKMNDILVQMRDKAEQAASDTLGTTERQAIQTQLSSFAEQIQNIVDETKWNGTKLLDGTVNKQFQTGADSGEVTNWSLSQNHGAGATGLNISTNVANSVASIAATSGGATNVAALPNTLGGLAPLQTGNYLVKDVAVAASTSTGAVLSGSTFGTPGFTLTASAPTDSAHELANGINNIAIKDYTLAGAASTVKISLDGGKTWSANQTITGNVSTGSGTLALTDAGGNSVGVTLNIAQLTGTDLSVQNTAVDYLKMGFEKAQLQTADGNAVAVAPNGASGAYFYLDGGPGGAGGVAANTGRGLSVTSDTFAGMTAGVGKTSSFNFQAKNAYAVDVSTADLASNYMLTVNNAMDTVNSSMASLGSLMARMSFKSDAISNQQVNVEASYSRIANANMAQEQVEASKYSILQQTATAMLAQANQAPQSLLTLFR